MSHSCYSPRTWYRGAFRVGLGFCLLGCLSLVLATKASAQEAVFVTGVEEDWELVVETPDPNLNGPQVTCSIAPNANDDSLYAAFELNHRTLPDFERGGMQLQVWSSEFNLANNPYPQYQLLSTAGETVTWTMSMRLQGENITFEVKDGHSTTWGNFGGQGYLRSSQACDLSNLNGYRAEDSINNSGVGYASNRVRSLTLKRVRYYLSNGDVLIDSSPRAVHQL